MSNLDRMRAAVRKVKPDTVAEPVPVAPVEPKPKKKWQKRPKAYLKDRLPDGSEFLVKYDATARKWSGSMIVVQTADKVPVTFTGENSSVFHLLSGLDNQYREYLEKTSVATAEPTM